MTTEEKADLLLLATSINDEVASLRVDTVKLRRAARDRALAKGWIVPKRTITDADGNVDVFTMTKSGKQRFEQLGGMDAAEFLFEKSSKLQ